MEFVVRAHSVKMDYASRDYAEAKIGKAVAKMTRGSNARVDVEVSKSTHGTGKTRVKVHVVIPHVPSETVHADESEMKAAIDVVDEMKAKLVCTSGEIAALTSPALSRSRT